ncbi:MAG: hypothetical protein ACD_21C00233G0002 [uncultured bacterium]|nr:MAG: hypothetical protein ACD_21C00233G0002 [uncultured bacterium]
MSNFNEILNSHTESMERAMNLLGQNARILQERAWALQENAWVIQKNLTILQEKKRTLRGNELISQENARILGRSGNILKKDEETLRDNARLSLLYLARIADVLSALEGQDSQCKLPSIYDIEVTYVASLKKYLKMASGLMCQIMNTPGSVMTQFLASDDIGGYNEQSAVLWLNARLQLMISLVSNFRESDDVTFSANNADTSNRSSSFRI